MSDCMIAHKEIETTYYATKRNVIVRNSLQLSLGFGFFVPFIGNTNSGDDKTIEN